MYEQGTRVLEELGFQVVHGDVWQKWRYLAGKDEHRFHELLGALTDPEIRAIFFARGGYGSSRLLHRLARERFDSSSKILFGCSDITSLHQYFQSIYGWTVFHGPMPSGDFARGQLHRPSFELAISQSNPYELSPNQVEILQHGEAEGILKGGCLTLLDAAMGTSWEPDWHDSILFLEDVATKPYQIDRMLTHLKLARKFETVRGFIFGEMRDCVQVPNQEYTLQEVILDLLGGLRKPICFNFPSGHVSGPNWTLPLGVSARLHATSEFKLEILEGAVR
jgi:muramoyltetrapeptide carboxypeptidase